MQLFNDFLMFVAPGLTIIASIIFAIWFASKDELGDNE